jgi:hypothetical protein
MIRNYQINICQLANETQGSNCNDYCLKRIIEKQVILTDKTKGKVCANHQENAA